MSDKVQIIVLEAGLAILALVGAVMSQNIVARLCHCISFALWIVCIVLVMKKREKEKKTSTEVTACHWCGGTNSKEVGIFSDGTERILTVYDDGTLLGRPFVFERSVSYCPVCGRKIGDTACSERKS